MLVLTLDPVADRIGAVMVAALTRTRRMLVSELDLTPEADGVPTACVVSFDNAHTIPRTSLSRQVTTLSAARMAQAARPCRRRPAVDCLCEGDREAYIDPFREDRTRVLVEQTSHA